MICKHCEMEPKFFYHAIDNKTNKEVLVCSTCGGFNEEEEKLKEDLWQSKKF